MVLIADGPYRVLLLFVFRISRQMFGFMSIHMGTTTPCNFSFHRELSFLISSFIIIHPMNATYPQTAEKTPLNEEGAC
jgi:hypothetical protein